MSFRRQHGKPSDIKQSMSHWSSSDIDEYNLIVIKSNNYRISSQTLAHRWISCIVRNDHIKHYQLHSFCTRAIQKCSLYAKYKRGYRTDLPSWPPHVLFPRVTARFSPSPCMLLTTCIDMKQNKVIRAAFIKHVSGEWTHILPYPFQRKEWNKSLVASFLKE